MIPKIVLLSLLASGAVEAEFLHIEVFIRDMTCPSCTETLVAAPDSVGTRVSIV